MPRQRGGRLISDPETVAIARIRAILAELDPEARLRVARYVLARIEDEARRETRNAGD
jgi:hypothetical protein